MQGGTRDFVLLRTALAMACAALIAMIAAPAALANSPAGDQYGSAIPGGGSGGSTSSSSPSGGSQTTIPVAPDTSSGGSSSTADTSGGSGHGGNKADATGSKGGSSHDGGKADKANGTGSTPQVNVGDASHSAPQVAADSAGTSWLPFFIGGMLALACAAAALVFFRNRRRTAQG
jgi:hypothetical protein